MNLKTEQLKLSSLRNKRKIIQREWTEPKGPLGYLQVDQCMHYMNPRRRRERKWRDHSKKMIVPNFPNLRNDINTNIEESQQTPSRMNSKKPRMRHIIIKLWKANNRVIILKASREKYLMIYKKKKKKSPIRYSAYFSSETLQAIRQWDCTFKGLKGGKLSTQNPVSGKNVLQTWGQNYNILR